MPIIEQGHMLVITLEPEVTYVVVDRVLGPIPGKGWLVGTQERNMLLVKWNEDNTISTRFITDMDEYRLLLSEVRG